MKKIILTGSSSGFGLLAAKTLAGKGNTVYATMRNVNSTNTAAATELRDWAKQNNAQIEVVEMDVTNDASVKNAVATITELAGGNIDVLINNAGIAFVGVSESLTTQQTDQLFQVNVMGVDRVMKAVLPVMHKQKDGLILNVSSVVARMHTPVMSTYNATKAAVDALSVGYHYELRSSGIDVALIQPGAYPTTDIVTNGIKAGNAAVEAHYGADMTTVKNAFYHTFTPKDDSPNPQEVADLMLQLVDAPKGERPLWNLIGAGALGEHINQVNVATKQIVDAVLGSMGVN